MNNIDRIRDTLIRATGQQDYDVEVLAIMCLDMINGDRLLIKILGRNIESLTMQMKEITQVTFERDKLKEAIDVYQGRLDYFREENKALRERLAKYE